MVPMVKNPPANAGDARDEGLNPGLERSPAKEMATHSCILAWKIPGTEEPGGLHSIVQQKVGCDSTHRAHPSVHCFLDIVGGVELPCSHLLRKIPFSSVQSCLTLCDPMDCSTPGLPVHCQLPEFTQTHVH